MECDFGLPLGLYEEGVGAVYVSPGMEFSQQYNSKHQKKWVSLSLHSMRARELRKGS